ncbi:MurR/RpiR family transcriptional regulator [Brevibacillus laterosporus]|uniref:MurR/RpiR family transcriptional regulator n=1 Tax=Brevibacillus laterosporus TaxID=1465 RepID=UPI000CE4FF30|nr:MurR/RpiR family transcriptional regulator [Brevibacillus laterosporus]MED1666754.1 MurR/RpiR family transcriptional regulator [Brevibacillus laterosporus]MED1671890.1 MurR/RpiR family transcriptional regulator [Brevibacillus laterosporus]MED1720980.1 MurR/RpiR family transcriptional regulator [Brevibacillus laterosporus]PPA81469.1 MurR/RpiR family transcriptional regulator [Brevibacillus laterosporus]
MSTAGVFERIQINYHLLSSKEKEIAEYIRKHKDIMLNINIKELAQKVETSTSTITRFCKKIGCNNFVEFKIMLSREVAPVEPSENTFAQVGNTYLQIIQSTIEMIDPAIIKRIVELIMNSRVIHIYGIGSSGLTSLEMKNRLVRFGLLVDAIIDPHMMLMDASLLTSNDLVICLSNTGLTREVIDAAREAKSHEATVISITNYNHTPLTDTSDIVLFTSNLRRSDELQFVQSQLAFYFIIDVISMLLAEDTHLLAKRQETLRVLYQHKQG